MIKRTLYFGNPAYLSTSKEQLVIKLPEVERANVPQNFKVDSIRTIPIEDIGIVILDNKQITLTQGLIEKLLNNSAVIITCDSSRMPIGMMLPFVGNTTLTERLKHQLQASEPLKKQLWQQTVIVKISNQAKALHRSTGAEIGNMRRWINDVKSGDTQNHEARAAVYYWANFFPDIDEFYRDKDGDFPNNLLNYGYAILRAVVARALVCSGLYPALGIFHKNKYNAYCLADDIMEPYRPYIDLLVKEITHKHGYIENLTTEIKKELLSIPVIDVDINGKRSPLMVAVSQTTASLYKCYSGESRKIIYPEM